LAQPEARSFTLRQRFLRSLMRGMFRILSVVERNRRERAGYFVAHGETWRTRGASFEAWTASEAAVVLDPSLASAHRLMAFALRDLGFRAEASASLLALARVTPADAAPYYTAGCWATEAQAWDNAARMFKTAIVLEPTTGQNYVGLAAALWGSKQFDEASDAIDTAHLLLPDDAEVVRISRDIDAARSQARLLAEDESGLA